MKSRKEQSQRCQGRVKRYCNREGLVKKKKQIATYIYNSKNIENETRRIVQGNRFNRSEYVKNMQL